MNQQWRGFPRAGTLFVLILLARSVGGAESTLKTTIPGTEPLVIEGDFAEMTVAGMDRFLLRELDESIGNRAQYWHRDTSTPEAYVASIEENRQRFATIIGLREQRVRPEPLELVTTRDRESLVASFENFEVFAVRWKVFEGVSGEGLLLEPKGEGARANLVLIPDCHQSPESLVFDSNAQIAATLAQNGCRIIIPTIIDRQNHLSVIANGRRQSTAHHREILYRAAYQMGRHLIGYEVQKILAAIDGFEATSSFEAKQLPVGVVGYGEGGLLALYAAAVDPRIQVTGVSGYFDSRQNIWREPIDRNIFGLLREFGDAETASLIAPRALVIEAAARDRVTIPAGGDSAPAELETASIRSVRMEFERARNLTAGLKWQLELVESEKGSGKFGSAAFLDKILRSLTIEPLKQTSFVPEKLPSSFDPQSRTARQFKELFDFSQRLVDEGPETRARFFDKVNYSSGLDAYTASIEPYRTYFRQEIIGVVDYERLPPNPRTRLKYDEPEYTGYEVVLDVFPDVILYGILLVPKDLEPGEKRPVVVCQHGLEGRAEHTVEGDYTSYRAFAARLAKRGFVTFSPQHLYRGGDAFRTLQRKANPLKQSLFSIMVAQHEQLIDWLSVLEFVDAERIAFYGISYGGKSAMRIPALVDRYCLSICSSDFSDWIWRTVSNRFESGYLAHGEYEIFEFNLGSTFNYAELVALICPRPFMVERFESGHLVVDRIAAEYGRARLFYDSLGIRDRTHMSYYPAYLPNMPYQERETFEFLAEQLKLRSQ